MGKEMHGKMRALLFPLILGGCAQNLSLAPPSASDYNPSETKRLAQEQTECFKREAQSKALDRSDLETAALGVQTRCNQETQRVKAYSALHTIEPAQQFEAQWRTREADDLQTIRQMITLVRTSR
jgi:hypothetical protein